MALEILGILVTLLGGGYLSKSLLLDPVVEFQSIKVDIDEPLIYHADIISNSSSLDQDARDEVSDVLRQDASQLESRANNIRGY